MNILTSKLPDSVCVNGKFYSINTDFKKWIEIENTFFDNSLEKADKLSKMLTLCYKELPPSLCDAIKGMMMFYCPCFSKPDASKKENKKESYKSTKTVKRIYSFEYDAPLIYSAFYSQYKIDLLTADLHWWQFISLFKGLSPDMKICRIMEIRAANIDEIKSKEQRGHMRRMKRLYALPDLRSDFEIESDMIEGLSKVF